MVQELTQSSNAQISMLDLASLLNGLSEGDPYTGVGARVTPSSIGLVMCAFALYARSRGLRLRSGAADGADLAFESGAHPATEIFVPYPGFNGSVTQRGRIPDRCFEMAAAVHPAWQQCSDFARKAHARNVQQVLGERLDSPSKFLMCWTNGGALVGGTRTAIVLAQNAGVPVINLGNPQHLMMVRGLIPAEFLTAARAIGALRMKGGKGMPPLRELSIPLPSAPPPSSKPQQSSLFDVEDVGITRGPTRR